MKENLSHQDWIVISAYLDGQLSEAEIARVDSRRGADSQFHQAFVEIKHTRKLLRSLPAKRAPKNFTLSQQYAKKPAKRWGMPSFLGLASISSALALVFVFLGTTVFMSSATRMAAPLTAAAPEMAMDAAAYATGEADSQPMIITWGQNRVYGMGGGGDSTVPAAKEVGLGGYGGGPVTAPEVNPLTIAATESPQLSAENAATADPSTLILGIPEPGTGGQVISPDYSDSMSTGQIIPSSTLWMIGLGVVSLVCGLLALLFRRR
jgi:hypothetical protein